MSISVHDHAETLSAWAFEHDGLRVGEIRTGNGEETELLILGHVESIRALDAFDAYTQHTCGWPLSEEYPTGWRIEHTFAITEPDREGGITVQVISDRQTEQGAEAFPVTRWTDEEAA